MKNLLASIALLFSLNTNASLIIGDTLLDSDGVSWQFVGSFMTNESGAVAWWECSPTNPCMFNGLEAAEAIFSPLSDGMAYATSTSDLFVNHLAWYVGYGIGGTERAEDAYTDFNNNGFYEPNSGNVDWSAWILDRNAGPTFVFTSTIPEPATLGLFGLALLAMRRFRRS